jgi:predicted ribosome quality control (RQC) complex YloA/Tae2 family protein
MKHETRYIAPLGLEIGFTIGQNAVENIEAFNEAKATDLWFHIEDHSSCHVIASMPADIKFDKKQTMYIVKQGAILCKQHSRYKSQQNVAVVYTTIQNVSPTHIMGTVTIQNGKTVTI